MEMNGLRVVRAEDEVYEVQDASGRVLGGVVRYWVPTKNKGVTRHFRAFGEDFANLGDAVHEFTKIRGVHLFDAKGDPLPLKSKKLTSHRRTR